LYFCTLSTVFLKIYNHIDQFEKVSNAVITLGTFDGVHLGHKVIIERLKKIAGDVNGQVVVLTFFPHPRMVLFPDDHGIQLLNTINERTMLMEKAGIDHLIIHPFSKEFSRMSSTEFVRDILVNKLGVKKLIIGYDHHFGRNREGSFTDLEELAPVYNFTVERIHEQLVNDVAVSSTKIRNSLLAGDVATAREFLGYDYELTGTVVHGKKLGHSLGFPTANLHIHEDYKLVPANGVYAARTLVHGQWYDGVMSIGNRPTFDNGARSIEVNLFDFNADIYGEKITICMTEFIRSEQKFENSTMLIEAMNADKLAAIKLLS